MQVESTKARSGAFFFYMRQTMILGFGVVLGFVLHELFHVIVHWGSIESIAFMPTAHALVQITATADAGHSVLVEELIAYGITLFVFVLTFIVLARRQDAFDSRSLKATVLPKKSPLRNLSEKDLRELMYQTLVL